MKMIICVQNVQHETISRNEISLDSLRFTQLVKNIPATKENRIVLVSLNYSRDDNAIFAQ